MVTDDAANFVNDAEARLAAVNIEQQRAAWVADPDGNPVQIVMRRAAEPPPR